jgi:hypothetical protein
MSKRFLVVLFLMCMVQSASAQDRLAHYLQFAHPVGTAQLDFPGPNGGFTLIHLRSPEVQEWGDTVIRDHTYLLDLNLSHDGLFLAPDTMKSLTDYTPFEFRFKNDHLLHVKLAPSHAHEGLRQFDTSFNGALGYGLIRQFVTAFDFKKNELTFYPLFANVNIADADTNVIQLPLIDDAKITYCGCPFPSIWLDAKAPPLNSGHVNLAFHEPISQVFHSALDDRTENLLEKQAYKDSIAGKKRPLGFSLEQFVVKDLYGNDLNLAKRSPRRTIVEAPAMYKDLSVAVLGTAGTDFLRTFSAIIIDPSRNKVIFVK